MKERINELVEICGISPEALSKNMKKGKSTVYNYLNGTTPPSVEFLLALIEQTKCNGHWLLTGIGDKFGKDGDINQVGNGNIGKNNGHIILTVAECVQKVKGLEAMIEKQEKEIEFLREIVKSKS